MDERTSRLREKNRKRRAKKACFNLKFAVDFLYIATIVLIIVGWAVKLPLLYLIAGSVMLLGTSYYIYNCVMAIKNNPQKSPEYKDGLTALIFFSIMFCIAILAIVFALVRP